LETRVHPALQTALIVGAWTAVLLLLCIGIWFLRRHQLIHTAVILALGLVGLYLLYEIRELVLMLVVAGIVAYILDPLVERIARRTKRPLAITLVYLLIFTLLAVAGTLIVPRIVQEARHVGEEFPQLLAQVKSLWTRVSGMYGTAPDQAENMVDSAIDQAKTALVGATGQIEHLLVQTLGWAVKVGLILVISIYLLLDKRNLREQFIRLFPESTREDVVTALAEMSNTFSSYLRGQFTVIMFVAVAVSALLLVFHIRYALFIGLMAGVLEVIPYFGALAGAVPAVALGFSKAPWIGVTLIVAFIAINQIEGHVVIPLVMGRNLEMKPLVILVSLIAGEMLFGIVGMIIAVPVVSLIRVLIPYVMKQYRQFKMRERVRNVAESHAEAVTLAEAVVQVAGSGAPIGRSAADPRAAP
jgi:predicted PurR-regulated permease PerM